MVHLEHRGLILSVWVDFRKFGGMENFQEEYPTITCTGQIKKMYTICCSISTCSLLSYIDGKTGSTGSKSKDGVNDTRLLRGRT